MTGPDADFRWRPILLPAYGPTAVASLGYGALAPVVALAAIDLGASTGVAALVVGLPAFGQLIGDLPAGALAARVGERRALIGAGLLDAVALLVAFASQSLVVLAAAVFVTGLAASVFNLARHAWMTEAIPMRYRARALSSLGGTFRIGLFVGPFISAGLISLFDLHAVFAFAAGTSLLAAGLTLTMPDLTVGRRSADRVAHAAAAAPADRITVVTVIRRHRRVLLTVGVGVLLLCAARMSRQGILPLWAESQHLDASTISVIFGISSGIELLLVYPAGAVMDRFGRTFVAVPATIVMGVALGLLPLTHTAVTICLVGCLFAIGSGLSAGIVLTLGSDAAPDVGRSQFLGAWRLFADFGGLLGPLLIALITAFGPLAPASLALSGISAVGAGWIARWVPRGRARRARPTSTSPPD